MKAFFSSSLFRQLVSALALIGLVGLVSCTSSSGPDANGNGQTESGDKPHIVFVTNQIASFWRIADVGCKDAGKELDVEVSVIMPPNATAVEQKRLVEDLIVSGVDGIAISPIDAENQIELLNDWASKMPLITQDSDAPASNRRMYIGMDNYLAGRMCGELVLKALPDGGNIMLCIGRLEQDNAQRRRQGVIDVLLGRSEMPDEYDPVGQELKGDKYTVIDTLTDQGDENVAKRKAEDAITTYPEMNGMVGLFAYNPPACLAAVKSQGKVGQIQVIGFDEDDVTLQGIKDGHCIGTVVQNPYEYGYQSIKVVKALIEGDDSVIPEDKFINIPARTITADNVVEFWEDLKSKTGG